ncbi:MAG: M14 family metallopeptidase [Pseudomonadota bacterium]
MRPLRHFERFIAGASLALSLASPASALEIEGVSIPAGKRTDLRLEVPAGQSDAATFIPVSVIRGAKPGPVFLMVAGIHGFEFASILAAERLAQEVSPEDLRGTLLMTRPAHVSAFEERSPYVNPYDRKNLNRSFPGVADGSQTERIAHALSTELIAKADFVADVHSGDGAEWLDAFVGVYGGPLSTDYETALAFARAMNFPNIVRYSMNTPEQIDRGRSLNRQAVAQGLPTVLIEIGQNGSRNPEDVSKIVDGITAAMAALSMIEIPVTMGGAANETHPSPRLMDSTTSVPVAHSGVWHPRYLKGNPVEKGEVLGVIRDYTGAVVETVRAPVSGYPIYGLAGPPVRAGDSVMSIGHVVDSLRD